MGFWWTNRVANPVLRRLLRTAAGRRLGRGLLLLRYTGRRTGRPHEVVTQYARAENAVWVLVGSADRKTWWRNLRAPADVEVWLAGERLPAVAVAVVGAEAPGECAAGLRAYLAGMPRAGRALGLPDSPDAAALGAVVSRTTLVRADLG